MTRKHLATVGWLTVSLAAFGLGWILRPEEAGRQRAAGKFSDAAEVAGMPERGSRLAARTGSRAGKAGEAEALSTSSRPLTDEDIEELGRQFRTELDPIKKRALFGRLLAGLTVENALQIRKQIENLDPNSAEFTEFHYAWGKIGGAEAVLHGVGTPVRDMEATLAGWASADPAAARAWFASLDKQGDRTTANQDHLKMAMVQGLANTDPARATEFVLGLAAAGDKQSEQMLGIITGKVLQSKGAAEAAAWATALPSGPLRTSAMSQVARDYAKSDPQAAAAWAARYSNDQNGGRITGEVSGQWARQDGTAAVGWVQSLHDGPAKSAAFYPAFENWAVNDPTAASRYLVTMPPSPDRDQAISGLVNRTRGDSIKL